MRNPKLTDIAVYTAPVSMGVILCATGYIIKINDPQLARVILEKLFNSEFSEWLFLVYIFAPPTVVATVLLARKNIPLLSKILIVIAYLVFAFLVAVISLFISMCMTAQCE